MQTELFVDHVPFTVGILVLALISCGISCICYSRMQQRRRRVLAAQLVLRLAQTVPLFLQAKDNILT